MTSTTRVPLAAASCLAALFLAGSLSASGAARAAAPAAEVAASAPMPAPDGTLERLPPFEIPALERRRTVRVWLPPSYARDTGRRYPVLYLHDGQNLFTGPGVPWGGWGVGEAMSTLARTRGIEVIVVAIDHGGEHRISELCPWPNARDLPVEGPAYLAFVVEVLKPWIDARYRTRPGREDTAMGGSSLGALVTHDALMRYPAVFGKGLLLSPAYWFTPSVAERTRAHPWPAGTRAWFYAGDREDESMVPDLVRVHALLAAPPRAPQDLALHVEPGAVHDERAWRAEFPRAVAWLFESQSAGAR